MTYARPEDFGTAIDLVASQKEGFPFNEISWKLIMKEYLLSQQNVERMEIIMKLAK